MTPADLDALEALLAQSTEGPLMAMVDRVDGVTMAWFLTHVEPAVCLNREHYYAGVANPPTDDYGYVTTSPEAEIDDAKAATLWLLVKLHASAPALLRLARKGLEANEQ